MPDERDESNKRPYADMGYDDLEREVRQLRLMSKTIDQFRSDEIPIRRAIDDLGALAQQLNHASQAWHESFVDAWADLEVPYAIALDRLTPMPAASDPTVRNGLHELSNLIAQHLALLVRHDDEQ